MISRWWHFCSYSNLRQPATFSLLAAIVIALLPVPVGSLPASHRLNMGKDLSQPFPCQDRPCGCRSAEQCRKKCCCFSTEQKLAWAQRHGVRASDVVTSTQKCGVEASGRKGCCSTNRAAKKSDPAGLAKSKLNKTLKTASRSRVVIGVVAQQCQGVEQALTGQAVFVIPSMISLQFPIEPRGERLIATDLWFKQILGEPPIPPPRLLAA